MWICPECETKNIDEARLCLNCGRGWVCPECNNAASGDACKSCSKAYVKINWLNKAEFEAYKEEKLAAEKAAAEKAAAEKAAAEKAAAEKAAAEKAAAEKA
ncbi:MAG: hypothetical protein J6R68_05920, partial [Clostridia bacterium]|nr:hypothetical protein [Clostridia bacterium]